MNRNTYITVILAVLACSGTAFAQGATEALKFSDNNYYGTARTISMGNAFTALGGDLGSVGINPAGSAVNGYSQFTITPSLSFYGAGASYDGANTRSSTRTTLNMPNVGAMLNFSTSRRSGLKSFSFGFVMNSTDLYNKDFAGTGTTDVSSFMGYLSDYATHYNLGTDAMNDIDKLTYYSDIPSALGHQALVVNPATASDGAPYVSPVQTNYGASGPYPMRGFIDQRYSYRTTGGKRDMVLNYAMNFSNRVFIGFNLGLVSLNYRENQSIKETAVQMADFPITVEDSKGVAHQDEFRDMTFDYTYKASGAGIYGKFGIIAVPVDGLRVGFSIQTPTAMDITETRYYTISTNLIEKSTGFSDGADLDSGDYVYEYRLRQPARYSFGLAYTIGNAGLISADYELTNYGRARYKERYSADKGEFDASNQDVQDLLTTAHYIRVGAEIKPVSQLAVRAGYNLAIAPKISDYGFGGNVAASALHEFYNTISAGVGYSSSGSFFCDFALRCKLNPREYYYPYPTYIDGSESPEIAVRSRLWDAVLTFGFRF